MRRLRGLLVGLLALTLAGSMLGGYASGSGKLPFGFSFGDVGDVVRGLVGGRDGGPPPAPPVAEVALPRKERAPTGERMGKPKRVRELTGKRTANTRFFLLSDGRVQAEVSSAPRFYRDGRGRYRPIDTTVRKTDKKGYGHGNATNGHRSYFGEDSDALVRVESNGAAVGLGLAGDTREVQPRVKGNTVTYSGVVNGADLVYRVTARGVKEEIVLRRPPAEAVYRFRLRLAEGVTAKQRKDGSIGFYRAGGGSRPVMVIPKPFMYDSKRDRKSPYGTAWSGKVTQTLQRRDGELLLTVRADEKWLRAEARKYPVTIDPTVKIQPTTAQSQDAMILSDDPAGNYDGNWRLSAGTTDTGKARSLLRFDLSGVPAGTQIDSARLRLYFDQNHTADKTVPLEARRVTQAWDESTVTWNSAAADMAEGGANVELVDDSDTTKVAVNGEWPASGSSLTQYAIRDNYHYNNNTATGETFTWVPSLTEDGEYQVQAHYVRATDRATAAPYTIHHAGGQSTVTVDQTAGSQGEWADLGTYQFTAGTSHKVVLGDVSDQAVIADAVRLVKKGTVVRKAGQSSVWHSYDVRNIAQDWLDGANPNHGLMVKAVDETQLGEGGPRYEAAEHAYGGENENEPTLLLTYGRLGVDLASPTTIHATGAELTWTPYQDADPSDTGDDIVEYQVHRSVHQTFTPSAKTLIAPVDKAATAFTDTTATPTPVDSTDPFGQVYYYMVAVKTRDGQVINAPTQIARLPRAGRTVQILQGDAADTTLASGQPNTNQDVLADNPWLMVGNNSSAYGATRAVVKFGDVASKIPSDAQVINADFWMWSVTTIGSGNTYTAHPLAKSFNETEATWNNADATATWTAPGGDYGAVLDSIPEITNDPARREFAVTNTVQGWASDPSSNHGLLVKLGDEAGAGERTLFLSSEAPEPQLRPSLTVTYTQPTSTQTYHAPDTPSRMIPGDTYTIPVTLNNPTDSTWAAADWELSYRWTLPDGTDVTTSGNQLATALPEDVSPNEAVDISAQLKTPIQSDEGNKRTEYVLKWELRNKNTGEWLSATDGIDALAQHVAVEDPTSNQLGLEKFYAYTGEATGAGSNVVNNLHAGNAVWSYDAFSNPSRGLSTFTRIAYNSLDTADTGAGHGWSLQASSLMRLGVPLDFHPNPNPTEVTLTDGDGTSHVFTWDSAAGKWASPRGVHLYLQRQVACGNKTEEDRAWVFTKPDRTQFFYDCDGYLSAISDNNGNELLFTYAERRSQNKPTKFLRYATDPAGRQTLTIDYYAKGEDYDYIDDATWTRKSATNLTNPKIIDHVKSITDISGRKLTFTYTDKGLLGELVDGAGAAQPKRFGFQYDMTQGNKNVKLVKITDPRGNATDLAYYAPPQDDPKFHWAAKSYTNRLNAVTSFAYTDPDGTTGSTIQTVVTDAENHATTYLTDGFGRPTQTVNAKNHTTTLGWDADNNVTRLEEDNGATSTWAYDQKTGYPLEIKDAEAVANGTPGTTLTYQTGLDGHIADLTSKTSPEGHKWTFGYTLEGDLKEVVDPLGNTTADPDDYKTSYTYDTWGQLKTTTDANGNTTTNSDFDPNGYPRTITDPLTNATTFVYDERGQVTKVTDPLGKDTTQTYDTFGRPLVNKVPKDQAAGIYITTPAPEYDPNDNVVTSTAPNGAVSSFVFDAEDRLVSHAVPKDSAIDPDRLITYSYDKVGRLTSRVEPLGNLTADPDDYTTRYAYDEINQVVSVTDADGGRISLSYDTVGNLVELVDARKNATPDTSDHAGRFGYDLAHRRTTVTDASGKTATREYDRDGLVTAQIDRAGTRAEYVHNPRGQISEVREPRRVLSDGSTEYATTRYEYDEVGSRTKVISPRGVVTADDPDDFTWVTVYDELNRAKETHTAYDSDHARYNTPDKTVYSYDKAGRLSKVSAPPSDGQSVRNNTVYSYYDNGWTKTSTDPWDIVTSYDYNDLGSQTLRKVTSAGGSSDRTMSWAYYPDGKLKARADEGVPVGKQVVLVDNSDFNNTTTTGLPGTWAKGDTAPGHYGHNYHTHAAGAGLDGFTWGLNIPQGGSYEVFVRYPQVDGAAADAKLTVSHVGGSTDKTVDQTANTGEWVSLGSYTFTEGNSHKITLTDSLNGAVVADAVKLVRNNTGEADTERKDYSYRYDANGNMTTITDASSGALVDTYNVDYDMLDRPVSVQESSSGVVKHTTGLTYDENGFPLARTHDGKVDTYEYDTRGLLSKIINAESSTDPEPKTTTYTYTPLGQTLQQVKPNGNTVDYDYYLDGALRRQAEKKSSGTLVAEHTYEYDLNNNRSKDTAKLMHADDHATYLDRVSTYTYDPRDRVAKVTKTGNGAGTETYVHDANNNVIEQTVNGVTTTANYDRNRLLSTTQNGVSNTYNYDPFGRLDTVTVAGEIAERYVYDGFDRIAEQRIRTKITRNTYDPLDRTATSTENVGAPKEKKTAFAYLGLTDQMLEEESGGSVEKSYQYAPWGERLSQVKHNVDSTDEDSYFVYNAHNDVEALTDENGNTRATYGYTAYGADEPEAFTGADKPDSENPDKLPYNSYRYNGMRWESNGGTYDMGFRNYDPGLNRFLTRDSYNGALADMRLGLSPWTNNRYAFAGGNPISRIELDGHITGHDAVVLATAALVEAWAAANGFNGTVTVDVGPGGRAANTIPGAHKSGDGRPGVADIIFWGEDVVYVWEVKIGSDSGRKEAPEQLQRYIDKLREHLQANGDNRPVRGGPPMGTSPAVPSDWGDQRAWSLRTGEPGVRYYAPSKKYEKKPDTRAQPKPPAAPGPPDAGEPPTTSQPPAGSEPPKDPGAVRPDHVSDAVMMGLIAVGVVAVGLVVIATAPVSVPVIAAAVLTRSMFDLAA